MIGTMTIDVAEEILEIGPDHIKQPRLLEDPDQDLPTPLTQAHPLPASYQSELKLFNLN